MFFLENQPEMDGFGRETPNFMFVYVFLSATYEELCMSLWPYRWMFWEGKQWHINHMMTRICRRCKMQESPPKWEFRNSCIFCCLSCMFQSVASQFQSAESPFPTLGHRGTQEPFVPEGKDPKVGILQVVPRISRALHSLCLSTCRCG